MKIHIHLDENETQKDINTLTLLNAVIKVIDEQNKFAVRTDNLESFINLKDFGEFAIKLAETNERLVNNIKTLVEV